MKILRKTALVFGLILATNTAADAATNYNMAPSGTATQVSTGFSGDASRAIDGNTNGAYAGNSVTHTADIAAENWWQVDLGEVKFINSIEAYNRTDTNTEDRATNYYIFISNTPFTTNTVAGTLAQTGVMAIHETGTMSSPTTYTVNRPGRYVRVQLIGSNYLNLAEIKVFGDDPITSMAVTKTADNTLNVAVGETVTYTYKVTNNSNVPLFNVNLTDAHNASDPAPTPLGEVKTDNAPTGDSFDTTSNDGIWSELGPGDSVTMTGTYTVTQDDMDNLQ